MEQESKQSERNPWAVVTAGGTKYLGEVSDVEKVVEQLNAGEFVLLDPCYEIIVQLMQVPHPQTRQPVLARNVTCLPFCATLETSPVWVRPDSVQLVDDLKDADQKRYGQLVEDAEKMATQQRAKDMGIATATPGQGASFG